MPSSSPTAGQSWTNFPSNSSESPTVPCPPTRSPPLFLPAANRPKHAEVVVSPPPELLPRSYTRTQAATSPLSPNAAPNRVPGYQVMISTPGRGPSAGAISKGFPWGNAVPERGSCWHANARAAAGWGLAFPQTAPPFRSAQNRVFALPVRRRHREELVERAGGR